MKLHIGVYEGPVSPLDEDRLRGATWCLVDGAACRLKNGEVAITNDCCLTSDFSH